MHLPTRLYPAVVHLFIELTMDVQPISGFSNQKTLELLLEGPYDNFQKVGDDDYRDRAEKNPGLSLSSKGYFNHKTGEKGHLSQLARDNGLEVSHLESRGDRSQSGSSGDKPEKSTSNTAAYLWKKAISGVLARPDIEDYLTNVRQIPPENYIDLISGGQLRFLPGAGNHLPALVQPLHYIEQDGSIREGIRKIQLTRKKGNPRKNQLGSDGHFTLLPPLDSKCADQSILAIEGLEDALSLRAQYSCKLIVVTCSKSNLKHLVQLARPEIGVLIIADHDDHDNPQENGQFEAARVQRQLRDLGANCVALMPKQPKWDANAALQERKLEQWRDSLVEVRI